MVANLAQIDPNQEIRGGVLGSILTILDVIRQQYGSRLILDNEIRELLMMQAPEEPPVVRLVPLPEPITAIRMQIALASVGASLRALEELEARTAPYNSAASEASYISPDTQHRDSPPGGGGNWKADPGDRQYRIAVGSQHRRASTDRPRGLSW